MGTYIDIVFTSGCLVDNSIGPLRGRRRREGEKEGGGKGEGGGEEEEGGDVRRRAKQMLAHAPQRLCGFSNIPPTAIMKHMHMYSMCFTCFILGMHNTP